MTDEKTPPTKKATSTKAIEAEAADATTFTVTWRDLCWELSRDRSEWSYEAGLALEDGKYLTAVRELLTDDQFAEFLDRKPKGKDAGEIINSIVEGLGADSVGGILGLDQLIRDHGDAVEADLCRYYGMDLVDYYRGTLTLRKLGALIKHLPSESAVARALGGDGFSMLELVVMEVGMAGELNPRHPFRSAEAQEQKANRAHLKERRAYYEAQRAAQAAAKPVSNPDAPTPADDEGSTA